MAIGSTCLQRMGLGPRVITAKYQIVRGRGIWQGEGKEKEGTGRGHGRGTEGVGSSSKKNGKGQGWSGRS